MVKNSNFFELFDPPRGNPSANLNGLMPECAQVCAIHTHTHTHIHTHRSGQIRHLEFWINVNNFGLDKDILHQIIWENAPWPCGDDHVTKR